MSKADLTAAISLCRTHRLSSVSLRQSLLKISNPKWDLYEGSLDEIVRAGLAHEHELPGQPGRPKTSCRYGPDGHITTSKNLSGEPGGRSIRLTSRKRAVVYVAKTRSEREARWDKSSEPHGENSLPSGRLRALRSGTPYESAHSCREDLIQTNEMSSEAPLAPSPDFSPLLKTTIEQLSAIANFDPALRASTKALILKLIPACKDELRSRAEPQPKRPSHLKLVRCDQGVA